MSICRSSFPHKVSLCPVVIFPSHHSLLPLPSAPPSIPRQLRITLLLLQMSLCFLEFCINGIITVYSIHIYSVTPSLLAWLLSFSMVISRGIPCHRLYQKLISFSLLSCIPLYECNTICLAIHMLMDLLVVSRFWLSQGTFLWLFMYKSLYRHMLLFFCIFIFLLENTQG